MNTIQFNLKRIFFALFIATLAAGVSQAQPYQTISTSNSIVADDLNRTVTTVQSGDNPLNRFLITKVKKADLPNEALKGAIFLLPPLGSGFQNYEVGENGDYNNSFVAFFARRNFLVVGYTPRQWSLTAGQCESGAIDCSPMADWGLARISSDPIRSLRDLNCGLAGETTFNNNLGGFNGPVIMFAGGHGFGPAMFSTAQLMTSANVTINFKPDYGHVDYPFSNDHLHELEHPILTWLLQKPFK